LEVRVGTWILTILRGVLGYTEKLVADNYLIIPSSLLVLWPFSLFLLFRKRVEGLSQDVEPYQLGGLLCEVLVLSLLRRCLLAQEVDDRHWIGVLLARTGDHIAVVACLFCWRRALVCE